MNELPVITYSPCQSPTPTASPTFSAGRTQIVSSEKFRQNAHQTWILSRRTSKNPSPVLLKTSEISLRTFIQLLSTSMHLLEQNMLHGLLRYFSYFSTLNGLLITFNDSITKNNITDNDFNTWKYRSFSIQQSHRRNLARIAVLVCAEGQRES